MADCHLVLLMVLFLARSIQSSSNTCNETLSLIGPKMAAMMNRNYTLCRDVDFRLEWPICEVHEKEEAADRCIISAGRLHALHTPCPDGTWNRTCYPLFTRGDIYHMNCVCQSIVHIPDDVRATYWSNLEAPNPPVDGVFYIRHLMMAGDECITQEMIRTGPVISGLGLPISVFSCSTNYASATPDKAHIDQVSGCWIPDPSDADPWLGITLPNDYMIKGSVINKKCSPSQPATKATFSMSHDGVTWQVVADREDLSARYDNDDTAYIWFTRSYISRNWRIYTKDEDEVEPEFEHVRADLIGSLV